MILLLRAIGAVALTGLISPLLFSAALGTLYAIETGGAFSAELVLFIAFYGVAVALPMAMIMGIFVEYPKLLWLRTNQGLGLPVQLLVSVLGAWSLWVILVIIVEGGPADSAQPFEEYLFAVSAFTIGGITFGSAWWGLVARNARAKKPTAR